MNLAILAAFAAFAVGPNAPVTWVVGPFTHQQPVEQQTPGGATQPDQSLWVVNNTGCLWDADDDAAMWGNGTLGPRETTSGSLCVIADWVNHMFYVEINAPSPNLAFAVSYDPQGVTLASAVIPTHTGGHNWLYRGCVVGPYYDRQFTDYQPIPGSNGGVGVPTTVSVTVTNLSDRRVRNVSASLRARIMYGEVGEQPSVCASNPWNNRLGVYPGPFWMVGL